MPRKRYRNLWSWVALILTGLCLASCAETGLLDPNRADLFDKKLNLSREDYRDLMPPTALQPQGDPRRDGPPIPGVSDILIAPRPPAIADERLVSISVTDDVPIRDVLLEMTRLADMELEMAPGIKGGIILRVHKKPFSQVMERIAQLANLRYEIYGDVLKVEADMPYVRHYGVDFMNMSRSTTGSISINTSVLSAGSGGGGESLSTGSDSTIEQQSESDLWEALEESIRSILASVGPPPKELTEEGSANGMPPEMSFFNANNPSNPEMAMGGGSNNLPKGVFYVINRQGGLLTIAGTQRQHREVAMFLEDLRRTSTAQVLIEAKIVEVNLSDEYRSGIDWNALFGKDTLAKFNSSTLGTIDSNPVTEFFSFALNRRFGNIELKSAVNLLERFGATRTLSSPRINALNNQQAVLTFAENQVYFSLNIEREEETTSAGTQEKVTIESEINTVPIGLILTLQPSINLETGEVTMTIRPTLSRVTKQVDDPAVSYAVASIQDANVGNIKSQIPVVEVRELDSMLKVRSGDVMVIGGLMEERTQNQDTGVPFFSSIPYVGNAFKKVEKVTDLVEMVIFIKATIIPPKTTNVHNADRYLYRKFTADPRPVSF